MLFRSVLVSFEELHSPHLKRGEARIFAGENRQLAERWQQYHTTEALCHVVPQPLGLFQRSTHFAGPFRDEMARLMQTMFESGIFFWWESIQLYGNELIIENDRRRSGYQQQWEETPRPISLDFEIMRIFPICGCLLAVATLVFLLEVAYFKGNCRAPLRRGLCQAQK